jgi:hypothetical protein
VLLVIQGTTNLKKHLFFDEFPVPFFFSDYLISSR